MRKSLNILFLFAIVSNLWSQDMSFKQIGDYHYKRMLYSEAIEYYMLCYKKNTLDAYCIAQIAACYQKQNNYSESEKWYVKIINNNLNVPDNVIYDYATCLYYNGKITEAKQWMEKYNALKNNTDIRAEMYIKTISNKGEYYKDSSFIAVEPLNLNSSEPDFGPMFYKDGIMFISSRKDKAKKKKQSYFDIFTSSALSKDNFTSPKKANKSLDSKYHTGPGTFYNNYQKLIITRSYEKRGNSFNESDEVLLQLFEADIDNSADNDWKLKRIVLLDANMCHPTVSSDGKTLYFASDYKEGNGEMDLYKSEWRNGNWSEPENLGNQINTKGNEVFPFILNDSLLLFSSNGHGGLGNLDIFQFSLNNPEQGIKNLGYPINSKYDDYSIIVHPSAKYGYFASNRPKGMGSDDIYLFENILVRINGIVRNENDNTPLVNVQVKIITENNEEILTTTDSTGYFEFDMNPDVNFEVIVAENDYNSTKKQFSSLRKELIKDISIQLKPIEPEPEVLMARHEPEISKKQAENKSLYLKINILDADGKKQENSELNLIIPTGNLENVSYDIIP